MGVFTLMRARAENAFQGIAHSSNATLNDIVRAMQAKSARLRAIDEEQYGKRAPGQTTPLKAVGEDPHKMATRAAGEHERSLYSVAGAVAKLTATYFLLRGAIGGVTGTVRSGIEAIDTYNLATVKTAAIVTGMMKPDTRSLSDRFAHASAYAERLNVVLEDVDKNTMLTFSQLQSITGELLKQGVVLDVTNKKEIAAFTQLSNALATIAAGAPNREIQLRQEARALIQGQVRDTDQLAQMLDAQLNGKLKEQVVLRKKSGDLLIWLGTQLTGFAAAQEKINASWETAKSSLETIYTRILRDGFGNAFKDIVSYTQRLSIWAEAHKTEIAAIVDKGWTALKAAMEASLGTIRAIASAWTGVRAAVAGVGAAWATWSAAALVQSGAILMRIREITVAVTALSARLLATPWGAVAAGVGLVAAAIAVKIEKEKEWNNLLKSKDLGQLDEAIKKYEQLAKASRIDPGLLKNIPELARPSPLPPGFDAVSRLEMLRRRYADVKKEAEQLNAASGSFKVPRIQKQGEGDTKTEKAQNARKEALRQYNELLDWTFRHEGTATEQALNALEVERKKHLDVLDELYKRHAITRSQHDETAARIHAITERERARVTIAAQAQIDEARIREEMAWEDIRERERVGTKTDIYLAKIRMNNELVSIYERQRDALVAAGNVDQSALIQLNDKISAARRSIHELDSALAARQGTFTEGIKRGFQNYTHDLKSEFENGVTIAETAFKEMEDSLSTFFIDASKGELDSWSKYVFNLLDAINKSIMDTFAQSIMETAIRPLVSGVGGFLGNIASSIFGFAAGGIIDSPALFTTGRGGVGVMAEAGPEAILPLGRTNKGELGVKVEGSKKEQEVHHHHYEVTINAVDAQSFDDAIRRNSASIRHVVSHGLRHDHGFRRHMQRMVD